MTTCSFCGKESDALHSGNAGASICAACIRTFSSETAPEFKPIPGRVLPRFAGVATFFRLPHYEAVKGADVAVLGIPFDGGTTYRPGARFAPREMRSASCMARAYQTGTRSDIFTELKICDAGDVAAVPTDLQKTLKLITEKIGFILDSGAIPLSVGGDHTVTLPILRAYQKSKLLKGRKMAVIHFDAHLDTYPPAWEVDYHHGTPFRHLVTEDLVDPSDIVQIGIRGPLAGRDDLDFVREHGFEVIMAEDVKENGPKSVVERLQRLRGKPVYVSFDIDGMDPAYAPGTGTPVPGGLNTYECQTIIRGMADLELVGMDLVEVSPYFDPTGVTNLVGLTMMQEWLGALAASRRKK